jgi:hypothetical protein
LISSLYTKYGKELRVARRRTSLNPDVAEAGSRKSTIVCYSVALQRTHPLGETPLNPTTTLPNP